ncbi:MAG: hypothetical protein L3J92_05950 [Thermoplasmata archaeon]|jgi:hypothetical protein|nr:hypothetical protein [Thermoplasmata archaeon]
MTRLGDPRLPWDFDVVGVSVGAALVSGALAIVGPSLAALTGSLAALAWAGWFSLARRTTATLRGAFGGDARWASLSVSAGAFFFLLAPPEADPFRALGLALSLMPLWILARRMPVGAV